MAVEVAARVTLCALPGVRVSDDGVAVTPEGKPLSATATEPLKLPAGAAVTLICWPAPPMESVSVPGVAESVKSPEPACEPHEARTRRSGEQAKSSRADQRVDWIRRALCRS